MNHLSLTENHLFAKAYAKGERYRGRYVCVYVMRDFSAKRLMLANPEKKYLNRVGIATSKKIGGAVMRSRARRVIRAALAELERGKIRTGQIIVIAAREAAVNAKSTEIYTELRSAFVRLGLIPEENAQ